MPSQLFSNESFATVAGASGIVFIVANTIQAVFNFNPRWLALAISELVALYGVHAAQVTPVPSDYVLALLNGCLIYCTAVGGTSIVGSAKARGRSKAPPQTGQQERRRDFTTKWF